MAMTSQHTDGGFYIKNPFSVVALMGVAEVIAFAVLFFLLDWMGR